MIASGKCYLVVCIFFFHHEVDFALKLFINMQELGFLHNWTCFKESFTEHFLRF